MFDCLWEVFEKKHKQLHAAYKQSPAACPGNIEPCVCDPVLLKLRKPGSSCSATCWPALLSLNHWPGMGTLCNNPEGCMLKC